jgi:hypothetical protein
LLLLLRGFFISVDPDEDYYPVESTFGTPGNEKRETRDERRDVDARKEAESTTDSTDEFGVSVRRFWVAFSGRRPPCCGLFRRLGIGGAELLVARRRNCPTLNEIVEPLCPSNLVFGTSGIGIVESTPVHHSPS